MFKRFLTRNYTYRPLKPGEIRVVVLEAGQHGTDLRGSLITRTLDDKDGSVHPPYKALSYTWGDPKCTNHIRIGHKRLGIASNLYIALQYLRDENESRVLWIDALCINQSDSKERSSQVQSMNLVYRGAECVLVWLGEQNENSDAAFDIIERWSVLSRPSIWEFPQHFGPRCGISSSEKNIVALQKAVVLEAHSNVSRKNARVGKVLSSKFREMIRDNDIFTDFDYLETDDRGFTCLRKTFNIDGERPWWGRRWVVQEVLNGRNIKIVCGNRSMAWENISKIRNSVAYLAIFDYPAHSAMSERISKSLQSALRLGFARNQNPLFAGISPTTSIARHLDDFSRTRCSDPRDLIYSILNICSASSFRFQVDYSKSVIEVFSSATKEAISESRNLFHLAYPGSSSMNNELGGPTWMRDYSRLYQSSTLITAADMDRGTLYSSAGASNVGDCFYWESRPQVLRLKGALHDTISLATNTVEDSEKDIHDTLREWEPDSTDSRLYPTSENAFDAFWRTLQKDLIVPVFPNDSNLRSREYYYRPQDRLNESDLDPFRKIYKIWTGRQPQSDMGLIEGSEIWRKPSIRFGPTRNNLLGYCFVTTSTDYMGIVHGQAQIGDQIYVAEGSPVPLILRPTANPFQPGTPEYSADENFYTLVGVSYVHGIMDGEFWEKVEAGEKELESLFVV